MREKVLKFLIDYARVLRGRLEVRSAVKRKTLLSYVAIVLLVAVLEGALKILKKFSSERERTIFNTALFFLQKDQESFIEEQRIYAQIRRVADRFILTRLFMRGIDAIGFIINTALNHAGRYVESKWSP